jgi:hypothetical protein
MLAPSTPVYIAFTTMKTLGESKILIVNVINRDGGHIRTQSDKQIVAGFGSGAKLRVLGGLLGGLKFLPRDVTIDIENSGDRTLIKVYVRDTMGFGTRIGLSNKYQEMMSQNAFAVKAAFPDAISASFDMHTEPRPDEFQASSPSQEPTVQPSAISPLKKEVAKPKPVELNILPDSEVITPQSSTNTSEPSSQVARPQQSFSLKCYNHPEIEAVATCTSCGKAICQTCSVDVAGKITCQRCLSMGILARHPAQPSKPYNPLAIVSLVLGILGLCGGIFSSIPAWIIGNIAQKQIAENPNQEGAQIANAGKMLGMVFTIIYGALLTCYLLFLIGTFILSLFHQGSY